MMLMSLNDKSSRNFLAQNKVETPQFEVSYRLRCQIHLFLWSGGFENFENSTFEGQTG